MVGTAGTLRFGAMMIGPLGTSRFCNGLNGEKGQQIDRSAIVKP
jgi:hypothetical protein